jgi:N-acyl-D-amino-acid deacylase
MDKAPYGQPAQYAEGIKHVLVNGVMVVKNGELQTGANPGRPVRAPFK